MARKKNSNNLLQLGIFIVVVIILGIVGVVNVNITENGISIKYASANVIQQVPSYGLEEIPEYSDNVYIVINDNIPNFAEEERITEPFEKYSELDILGRCGVAYANVCKEIIPKDGELRGDISSVHPTGWKQKRYSGEYLYNRCHLIGYQLSAEDANKRNLITGTRYFNVEGMLPFENQVANYIKQQNRHVLYRVTPMYQGENLVAKGVQIEAFSVEDNGEGVCFNVFVYNVQPGIVIDYSTGDSYIEY